MDRFNDGSSKFPFMGLKVEFYEKFKMITAVDFRSYSIDPQRGIHIGELFYWSPKLSDYRDRSKKVEVRIDPENPHLIFALVNNVWEACYSSHINRFNALDFETQFIEGLIALETSPQKSKIKHEANKSLVDIISALDQKPKNKDQFNLVNVGVKSGVSNEEGLINVVSSIFDDIKSMSVKSIRSEGW